MNAQAAVVLDLALRLPGAMLTRIEQGTEDDGWITRRLQLHHAAALKDGVEGDAAWHAAVTLLLTEQALHVHEALCDVARQLILQEFATATPTPKA